MNILIRMLVLMSGAIEVGNCLYHCDTAYTTVILLTQLSLASTGTKWTAIEQVLIFLSHQSGSSCHCSPVHNHSSCSCLEHSHIVHHFGKDYLTRCTHQCLENILVKSNTSTIYLRA